MCRVRSLVFSHPRLRMKTTNGCTLLVLFPDLSVSGSASHVAAFDAVHLMQAARGERDREANIGDRFTIG